MEEFQEALRIPRKMLTIPRKSLQFREKVDNSEKKVDNSGEKVKNSEKKLRIPRKSRTFRKFLWRLIFNVLYRRNRIYILKFMMFEGKKFKNTEIFNMLCNGEILPAKVLVERFLAKLCRLYFALRVTCVKRNLLQIAIFVVF